MTTATLVTRSKPRSRSCSGGAFSSSTLTARTSLLCGSLVLIAVNVEPAPKSGNDVADTNTSELWSKTPGLIFRSRYAG
jgi:hypothetical protein